MNALFGIPLDTIMSVSLGLFVAITTVVLLLAARNRLMLKMGLRNIPRRRAQTTLIIVGLMLSTVIITSAFSTGDTLSMSIRSSALTQLGAVDEIVTGSGATEGGAVPYFPAATAELVRRTLAPSGNVDGVIGAIAQRAALQDMTSRQTKASVELLGVPANYPQAFGTLTAQDGAAVTLGQLSADQIYINQSGARSLDAHAGDVIRIYVGGKPVALRVHAVVRDGNLVSGGLVNNNTSSTSPTVVTTLGRLQQIVGRPGSVNIVLISNSGDAISGAALSDKVVSALRAPLTNTTQVAAIAALLSAPRGQAALAALQHDRSIAAGVKAKLRTLEARLALPATSDRLKLAVNDKDVVAALRSITDPSVAAPLTTALASLSNYSVQSVKSDALASADLAGSEFSSIFIVFGLFSIAAGIMLIFLIFVMLAAERRAEMGMARAIGTKRRHLIEQFLFEGYVYDLGAALVGAALGIAVGLGMVSFIASLVGSVGFTLQPQITARSVVVAFCIGALVTFITVAFSSWRVSRLNIVSAIRDLPEDLHVDGSIAAAFRRPLADLGTARRRLGSRRILGAVKALLAAPWHLIWAFRVFIGRGPVLLLLGFWLMNVGIQVKQLVWFNLGISLLLIGGAMALRWALGALHVADRVRNRLGYSLAGVALVVFWLLPFDALRSDLHFDIEMFFLSGMMLVLGGVWTVMYNSDLILAALMAVFGRIGSLAPVLKTAVTYPQQNRVRTGLTLSMFSLVIFTLMVMSVLTGSFGSQSYNANRDTGGFDIYASASPLNPIRDVAAQVAANPALRGRVSAAGSAALVPVGLRMPPRTGTKSSALDWQSAPLNVLDASYLEQTRFTLHLRANGYSSDAQVWNAVRTHPGYVVVDGGMVNSHAGNNGGAPVTSVYYDGKSFKPATVQMRDVRTGKIIPLTVIGVLDQRSFLGNGIYAGQATLSAAHDLPADPTTYYFRVAPGQDVHTTALALGSAFLANGLDVQESAAQYALNQSLGVGINTLLEGFMALGLVVGIAALGVVATRSVVERRQHIGMLRAIGFQRGMVQASFLIESSFISIAGTALGAGLGLMLARQLIANFAKTDPSLQLVIPWSQVGLIVLLAYGASLLTTYLPSWQASRIYPAEALRYE